MADIQQYILVVTIVICDILYCVSSMEPVRNCNIADKTGLPDDVCTYDLLMKGAHPKENDQYYCSGYDVSNDILGEGDNPSAEGYIVKYEAIADANTAHHILVFGCESLRSDGNKLWKCGQVCGSGEQIVFAWAKNAPPLTLPKGVGQHIGGRTTKINHIVIQIHYVNPLPAPDYSGIRLYTTKQRQPFISGIYLLLSYGVTIPANTPKFHVDSSCVFNWADSIVPFGYRTHAHTLGSVISGYKVNRGGESTLVGKGNPQWPQAFYPVKEKFEIKPGDLLAARCTYNSTGRFRDTEIGSTSNDEMCNFYIMYYMNSTMELRKGTDTCYRNLAPQVFQFIPADNDVPLPSNPDLEQMAHGHHHGMGVHPSHNDTATTTSTSTSSQLIDEPKVDVEKPLVDISDINNGMDNTILKTGYQYQGTKPLSTSQGTRLLDNSYRQMLSDGYKDRKPPSYFMDYPGLNDYYDILQSRSRNRLKKPYYDIYDSPLLDYADFSNKQLSSLSRNRNKVFNDKYDEYSTEDLSKPSRLSHDSIPSQFDALSGTRVAKVNQNVKQSDVPPPSTGQTSEALNIKSELGLKYISSVENIEIGQVGGLAVSRHGDLYIFHRGSNIWDAWSFSNDNVFRNPDKPIEVDTVIVLNKNGDILRHFGKNRFFLPHGLTVDSEDNIWLTDVGLHQVFRIPKGSTTPDITLGTRFEPGDDKFHFCKPSDIAVMSTGEIYVSDGYCNSRIVKFDKNGYYIKQWGTSSVRTPGQLFPPPGTFNLPHSLALAEDKQLICVADRENGRIQCFDLDGKFVRQIHHKLFGAALYAVEYCPNHDGILFAVNGPLYGKDSVATQGFTIDINNGDIVSMWNIPGSTLTNPHDVTVDSSNHIVYVGELNPQKVWKFQMSQALYSTGNSSEVNTQPPVGVKTKSTPVTEVTKRVSKETSTINIVKVTNTMLPSNNENTMSKITSSTTPHVIQTITTPVVVNPLLTTLKSNIYFSDKSTGTKNPSTVVKSELPTTGSVKSTVVKSTLPTTGSVKSTVVKSTLPTTGSVKSTVVNPILPVILNKKPYVVVSSGSGLSNGYTEENTEASLHTKTEAESDGIGPSVIIGTMLVVPVLILIIVTVTVRLYKNGHFRNCGRMSSKRSVFSLGNFLHSHKGFDRLSTEDDDHDFENVLDDSDNEEFNITRKA